VEFTLPTGLALVVAALGLEMALVLKAEKLCFPLSMLPHSANHHRSCRTFSKNVSNSFSVIREMSPVRTKADAPN
jgi:hypothetical protein